MAVDSLKGSGKPRSEGNDQTKPKLDPLGQRAVTLPVSAKHSCIKSHFCKPDWGLLDCIELYKLASAEVRRQYCRLSSCCNRCGAATHPSDFKLIPGGGRKMKQKCDCGNNKMTAHCTKDWCWFSSATCQDHKQTPNATRELLDWLKQRKIRNNLFTVPGSGRLSNSGRTQDREEECLMQT